MATGFVAEGDRIPHTPGSDVAEGAVVLQSKLHGVATEPISSGVLGSLAIEGIFELPKVDGVAFSVGDVLYWDVADSELQKDADSGTNLQIGKCTEAAASGATTARVKLTPGVAT